MASSSTRTIHPSGLRRDKLHRSFLVFALSAVILVTLHVSADAAAEECPIRTTTTLWSSSSLLCWQKSWSNAASSFWQRLRSGPEALVPLDKILFVALILLAFELLDFLTKRSGKWLGSSLIPVRGKHLDVLTAKDLLFIGISKAQTAPFVYLYLRYCYLEPYVLWADASVYNVLLPLLPLFIVYDFFYTLLHWFLHVKAIYGYIHKHHHVQKAPSRANVDAVNVHPIEFFLGEYNHLLAVALTCRYVCQVHVVGAILFLAVGGILAGINHTRYDIVITMFSVKLYDSKAHDVHHRIPQSNYGQYIMLWDYCFGSYRPYNPKDRINPESQLDPTSGKSIAYMKEKKARNGKAI